MSDAARAAAGMLVVGFPGNTPSAGFRRLAEQGVAGAILFARNLPEPEKAREVTGAVKAAAAGRPMLVCVDQEGGRVMRLRGPFTAVPSMRRIGATGDVSLARDAGLVLGRELRAAGFDVNFTPVVDVDTNPANPVIGDRSFGRDPMLVGAMAIELLRAMQDTRAGGGIAACAKHFPGHGDTSQDSHIALPKLNHDLVRLESVELQPFKAAIDAGISSVMSAHVIFAPLDAAYPATMSRAALGAILRDRFKFDGVIFSDCMEMKAMADHFALEDQLRRGVEAGIDLFLISHTEETQRQAIKILAGAIERGVIPPARVAESQRRIAALVSKYCRPLGTTTLAEIQAVPEHRAAAARLLAIAAAPLTGSDPTARQG